MSDDSMKFFVGKAVRRIRKKANITQATLAEMADMSAKNISAIESGRKYPKPATLNDIAVSLDTTPEEMIKDVKLTEEVRVISIVVSGKGEDSIKDFIKDVEDRYLKK